jgi:hypothetical protein
LRERQHPGFRFRLGLPASSEKGKGSPACAGVGLQPARDEERLIWIIGQEVLSPILKNENLNFPDRKL